MLGVYVALICCPSLPTTSSPQNLRADLELWDVGLIIVHHRHSLLLILLIGPDIPAIINFHAIWRVNTSDRPTVLMPTTSIGRALLGG